MTLLERLASYRKWLIVALCVVILFFLIQFVLGSVVQHFANAAINDYPGLSGEIGSVKLRFIPGEYLVKNVKLLHKTDSGERETFSLEELGVRVYWRSLFKGIIEGDGWALSPSLIIWAQKGVKEKKPEKMADWRDQIRRLVPFKINTFDIRNATVVYRDIYAKPPVNLKVEDISLLASNLTNRAKLKDAMFAKVSSRAKLFESGHAELDMVLDPLAKHPTFSLQNAIKDIDITKLNDLLMAYGGFDVDRGTFSLFSEIVAKNGKFVAYAKPIFRNLDVAAWQSRQHRNNKLLVLWKNIMDIVADLLKNKEKDQLATKIKAEGTFDDPDVSVWDAVVNLLYNGFIQALIPGYDNSITWSDVPN